MQIDNDCSIRALNACFVFFELLNHEMYKKDE